MWPPSIATLRLLRVSGVGSIKIALIAIPFSPPSKIEAPLISDIATPSAKAEAISPAALPKSRASFQTETVCEPRATRLIAARSPS